MGCPDSVILGDNATFSICTHDPDTGIITDTDEAPAYRVYEDETATPILTGTMAKLDDANTTGFYTETINCTTANGFELGKTYTVYITAVVGGSSGGIAYGFKIDTKAVRKNRAFTKFPFPMTDSTNHAPVVGKTVTCTRAIDGAAFAAGTLASVIEIANGMYAVNFAAADLNGDSIILRATATGCDDTFLTIVPE